MVPNKPLSPHRLIIIPAAGFQPGAFWAHSRARQSPDTIKRLDPLYLLLLWFALPGSCVPTTGLLFP